MFHSALGVRGFLKDVLDTQTKWRMSRIESMNVPLYSYTEAVSVRFLYLTDPKGREPLFRPPRVSGIKGR